MIPLGLAPIPPLSSSDVDDLLDEWVQQGIFVSRDPLTRQHVTKLIEFNGNTSKGLGLESRDFHGQDLHDLDLQGANLENANLQDTNLAGAKLQDALLNLAELQGADLTRAQLQRAVIGQTDFQTAVLTSSNLEDAVGFHTNFQKAILRSSDMGRANLYEAEFQCADLRMADLRCADLRYSNLDGSNLENANLEGAKLHGAKINRDTTRFHGVIWGKKMKLGEELAGEWGDCLDPYRDLKQWHQHNGDYVTAGKFHYREWECKRKLAQKEKRRVEAIGLWIDRLANGYGERWRRVIFWGVVVIAFFALIYLPYLVPQGTSLCLDSAPCWNTFATYVGQSLYFSGASFTALGYGEFAPEVRGWSQYLGVVESFIGISLIALFLVTFTRKMTR